MVLLLPDVALAAAAAFLRPLALEPLGLPRPLLAGGELLVSLDLSLDFSTLLSPPASFLGRPKKYQEKIIIKPINVFRLLNKVQ